MDSRDFNALLGSVSCALFLRDKIKRNNRDLVIPPAADWCQDQFVKGAVQIDVIAALPIICHVEELISLAFEFCGKPEFSA